MSQLSQRSSNTYTIIFVVILSFVCALILSVLASALAEPKEQAKELDRSKEMMIAAGIFTHGGYFQITNDKGEAIPAKVIQGGVLVPGSKNDNPTREQILEVYKQRLKPFLVNSKGNRVTFEQAKIDLNEYITKYRKEGYYKQPYKLIYEILPNKIEEGNNNSKVEGYIIPVNGFGLWDAIYGFLAIKPDGDTVIGTSWYDQKETPGLGANIAESSWQSLFPGKLIFQTSSTGKTDFKTTQLGIVVVRGKVAEVLGSSPKAMSAVDGMAGATLTGNGVTKAYQDVLAPYRPFLIKLHEEYEKNKTSQNKESS